MLIVPVVKRVSASSGVPQVPLPRDAEFKKGEKVIITQRDRNTLEVRRVIEV